MNRPFIVGIIVVVLVLAISASLYFLFSIGIIDGWRSSETKIDEGLPAWVVVLTVFVCILALILQFTPLGNDSKNLTMAEAEKIMTKDLEKRFSVFMRQTRTLQAGAWYGILPQPAQKIEGEPDAWWYLLTAVRVKPASFVLPPRGDGMITYAYYSKDHERGFGVFPGWSKDYAMAQLKLALQKNSRNVNLDEVVKSLQSSAEIERDRQIFNQSEQQ